MGSAPTVVLTTDGRVTYRLFRDLDADLPGMAAANQANRAAMGILEPADLSSMRSNYERLVNSVATRDILLAELDGRIVAYVRTSWSDQFDGSRVYEVTLFLDPAAWDRGIARTLIDWAGDHHRQLVGDDPATHPPGGSRWLQMYAFDGDREIADAAAAAGYRIVRREAEMLRDRLDDVLPDVPLPDGFTIRPVTPELVRPLWDAGFEAFADSYGESVPTETDFEKWRDDPRNDFSLAVVAFHGEAIASFVLNILDRQPDGSLRGQLGGVATLAPYRRRGLARALVARSLALLRDHGATSAYLGVDLQNPNQALTLYGSCGFRVVNGGFIYRQPFDGPWPEEPSA